MNLKRFLILPLIFAPLFLIGCTNNDTKIEDNTTMGGFISGEDTTQKESDIPNFQFEEDVDYNIGQENANNANSIIEELREN